MIQDNLLPLFFNEEQLVALAKKGIRRTIDLLCYFPTKYIDRSKPLDFRTIRIGELVTFIGTIAIKNVVYARKRRLVLKVKIDHGFVEIVYFQGISYLSKLFFEGQQLAFSGKIESFKGKLTMTHPEHEFLDKEELVHTGKVIPLYKIPDLFKNRYLTARVIRESIHEILKKVNFDDYLDPEPLYLTGIEKAIKQAHFPESVEDAEQAITRIAFDEIILFVYKLNQKKISRKNDKRLLEYEEKDIEQTDRFIDSLPFKLTNDQEKAIQELRDMAFSGNPYNVLLQGDVGSGKTLVALVAMLDSVFNGGQAVLMAPTEILARQHFQNFQKFLFQYPFLQIELLVGGEKAKDRNAKLDRISRGETSIIVGTHALIQPDVRFKQMSLAVIDEQHRFGVEQRKKLTSKSKKSDFLAMSATPIPRSLTLAIYGDMETILLKNKPAGRLPIDTRVFPESRLEDLYKGVKKYVDQGRQAYIIYPLIDEAENSRFSALLSDFNQLEKEYFNGYRLGLLHGKLKEHEKDYAMQKFQQGVIQVLVSTTVVEVGVDVPNATVMLIRNADKFGLSQLHQLRGRVGRGAHQSFCILVESDNSTQEGKERLATLHSSEDGFYLAQKDFEMRGSGEIFGTRQAGVSEFQVADLRKHGEIAVQASQLLNKQKDIMTFINRLPKRLKLPDLYGHAIHQFASQADSS